MNSQDDQNSSDDRQNDGSQRPEVSAASFFVDNLSFHPDGHLEGALELPPDTDEYRFNRELGRGGMGLVYACDDLKASREVALKVVIPSLQVSKDALERFEQEARAAASISHPNCVFVYGAHLVHGSPAIAMELMPGKTLDDVIDGGKPMPIQEAIQATLELLDGLGAAHEKGVLHRDIKPSNLFLTEDGQVKLGDFGLSRNLGGDLKLTRTGMFLGTPLYSSPEQVRGKELDERSDLYSVGAVLFALVTGDSPFQATSIGDLFAQIITEDPPNAREINEAVPHRLAGVLIKALAKQPADRFRNVSAFRAALQSFLPSATKTAPRGLRITAGFLDYGLLMVLYFAFSVPLQLFVPALRNQDQLMVLIMLVPVFSWLFLFEFFLGGTPFKLLMGLRVRGHDGSHLSFRQATLRSSIMAGLEVVDVFGFSWLLNGSFLALAMFITARRKNSWRGIHELASGTRTTMVSSRLERILKGRKALSPERRDREHLPELPQGFEALARIAKTEEGQLLLAREERLHRKVWFHLFDKTAPDQDSENRGQVKPHHLHWLVGGANFDVYEDVGGASTQEFGRSGRGCDWEMIRDSIATLAKVESHRIPRPGELWLDGRGHLRILDFAIQRSPKENAHRSAASALIVDLTGNRGSRKERLPRYLPEGAATLIRGAVANREIDSQLLDRQFNKLEESGDPPPHRLRAAQLGLTGLFGFLGFSFAAALGLGACLLLSGTFVTTFVPTEDVFLPMIMLIGVPLGMIFPSVGLSWLLRRTAEHAVLGIVLLNEKGERASRNLAAQRSLLAWAPLVLLNAVGGGLWIIIPNMMIIGLINTAAMGYLMLSGIFSMIIPDSSPHDKLLKTHLVH